MSMHFSTLNNSKSYLITYLHAYYTHAWLLSGAPPDFPVKEINKSGLRSRDLTLTKIWNVFTPKASGRRHSIQSQRIDACRLKRIYTLTLYGVAPPCRFWCERSLRGAFNMLSLLFTLAVTPRGNVFWDEIIRSRGSKSIFNIWTVNYFFPKFFTSHNFVSRVTPEGLTNTIICYQHGGCARRMIAKRSAMKWFQSTVVTY